MVMGRQLEAKQIEAATRVIADQGLNIDSIIRLTGRKSIKNPAKHTRACIEFSLRGEPANRHEMQSKFLKLSAEMEIDFSFQRDDMFRRMRRLICFDMDSTLIQTECIDELAERAGVGAQVRAITESAMRGEIDFKESFTRRVKLLKGLDVSVMQDIAEHLPITEGVDRLMTILKRCGYKIAILSGGFTYFGEHLQRKYGIDYVYANELEVDENGKLTAPIRVICPGRVYRNEAITARAHCFFHQVEGLYIDKNVSFTDLKQVLLSFAKEMFGADTKIRLRPSYFPFTEPSAEMDISCFICGGEGCGFCKHTGWVEILGCGMVDPNVLELCGIDSKEYTGYAFGMGVERITNLKYRVSDLRMFSENDTRFLEEFESAN